MLPQKNITSQKMFCVKNLVKRRGGWAQNFGVYFFLPVFQFPNPREAYIPNLNPLVFWENFKKLAVSGGGGGWVGGQKAF